ncbi:unnamed protein product [Chrysoparadoxa australica]
MVKATAKTLLLRAVEGAAGGDAEQFISLLQKRTSDDFDVQEGIEALSKKEVTKVWSHLLGAVKGIVNEEKFAYDEDEEEGVTEEECAQAVAFLTAVTALARAWLEEEDRVAPADLLQVAEQLHCIMLYLGGAGMAGANLQVAISRLCEKWWLGERPGADQLVACLLPWLLATALQEDGTAADVKRMYAMRNALLLLDFDDRKSSEDMRELLLRALINPAFLRCAEGQRFLTFIFGLTPSLIEEIHSVIKPQLPKAKKTLLKVYGEIYFKAWKGCQGKPAYSEKVSDAVQDLMHSCVHAASPGLHKSLLALLKVFHDQKKVVRVVDALLLKLYGPFLWHALKVANPAVREQACTVLVDAFPLQDPNADAVAADKTLQKQFDALWELLDDTHPTVRAAAVRGACRILTVFWEAIPSTTTRPLLTKMAAQLAFDASSPAVRVAVVEGMTALLDCPLALGVLKALLPSISSVLHDKNPRVRLAFVHLLQRVKAVRQITYYHICHVDAIQARLAADAKDRPAIASAITKLLMNSYFPQGGKGEVQVSRCIVFMEQNPSAATAFYSHIAEHAGVGPATKMIVMLTKVVLTAIDNDNSNKLIKKQQQQEKKKTGKGKKRAPEPETDGEEDSDADGGEKETNLTATDSNTMANILRVVTAIWASIASSLPEPINKACQEMLDEAISPMVLRLFYETFKVAEGPRAELLNLAGFASSGGEASLLEDIIGELLSMPADADPSSYGPIVSLLCAWKQQGHLVAAVVDSLNDAFSFPDGQETPQEGRKKHSGKRPRGGKGQSSKAQLPPALALGVLGHLLEGKDEVVALARQAVVGDAQVAERVRNALDKARVMADTRLWQPSKTAKERAACPDAMLIRALELLGRLHIHESTNTAAEEDTALPFSMSTRGLMIWMSDRVLPALNASYTPEDGHASPAEDSPAHPRARRKSSKNSMSANTARARSLACGIATVVMALSSDWLALMGPDATEITTQAETWGKCLLDRLAEEEENAITSIAPMLPLLCRLVHQLSGAGCKAPSSLWEVLLRCAHLGVADETNDEEAEIQRAPMVNLKGMGVACVPRMLKTSFLLHSRNNTVDDLTDRLLGFAISQSHLDIDEEESPAKKGKKKRRKASSPSTTKERKQPTLAELRNLSLGMDVGAAVQLSPSAASVLASILHSNAACRSALNLSLKQVTASAADPASPVLAAFLMGAMVDFAPPSIAAEVTLKVHSTLKLHPACQPEYFIEDEEACGTGETPSTAKLLAAALQAVYLRLEEAHQNALSGSDSSAAGSPSPNCSSGPRVEAAA